MSSSCGLRRGFSVGEQHAGDSGGPPCNGRRSRPGYCPPRSRREPLQARSASSAIAAAEPTKRSGEYFNSCLEILVRRNRLIDYIFAGRRILEFLQACGDPVQDRLTVLHRHDAAVLAAFEIQIDAIQPDCVRPVRPQSTCAKRSVADAGRVVQCRRPPSSRSC